MGTLGNADFSNFHVFHKFSIFAFFQHFALFELFVNKRKRNYMINGHFLDHAQKPEKLAIWGRPIGQTGEVGPLLEPLGSIGDDIPTSETATYRGKPEGVSHLGL